VERFQIHIDSGQVVVIDPLFIDYAQNPICDGIKPYHQNELFKNSRGHDRLRALEAIAMGRSEMKDELKIVGLYDLRPIEPGAYTFAVGDIRRVKSNSKVAADRVFSVDTGQVLIFDVKYLDGVLEHFSWKNSHSWLGGVSRWRERKHGRRIAGRGDVYVQVQSPGINRGVAFIGDGEYYFRDEAFRPVAS
jgi:hypothetical protein